MQEVSAPPEIGDGLNLDDDPSIQSDGVTATRFRVLPGDHYEAWQAKMWVKGNKVLSLPYFTNETKKVMPGKVKLMDVKYSSNESWGAGASYRYTGSKARQGYFETVYNKISPMHYAADIRQAFQLNSRTSGGLSVANLFSGGTAYTMSMFRHGGATRSFTADANYAKDRPLSFHFGGNTLWNKMRVQGSFQTSKMKMYNQSSSNGILNIDRDTRYIGKARKLGYNANAHMDYENQTGMHSVGSMFVAVSAFSSGINISRHSHVNLNTSTGWGADTEGRTRASIGNSIRYNVNVGRGKLINIGYNVNNGTSYGQTTAAQSLSAAVSLSSYSKFNANIATAYDLRQSRFGEVSTALDYTLSKKCRIWSSLIYDLNLNHFSMKDYNMSYNLYGETINTTWVVESNDFIVDFASKF
jgi:hypothetical protein